MDLKITSLEGALATLNDVSDVNYPTIRHSILQKGGDDFLKGIRISLPPKRIVVETGNVLEDGSPEIEVHYEDADPYEIEKETLVNVVKNVLQVAYTVRWLSYPLSLP